MSADHFEGAAGGTCSVVGKAEPSTTLLTS